MSIPIKNIYYLLCYAWNKLEEKDLVKVDPEEAKDMLDLLVRILISGTRHLLLRGLDRSYTTHEAAIPGIKGKLNLQVSLQRNLFPAGKAQCAFDEFTTNILHNQILKTTLRRLIATQEIEPAQKKQLLQLYRRMGAISEIPLDQRSFDSVQLHRNNKFYGFPLKLCELIYQQSRPSEDDGNFLFQDFTRNHLAMAALFEEFVRKFFQVHLGDQFKSIDREYITWNAVDTDQATVDRIPKMETDVTLVSEERKIILDAKFYHHTVKGKSEKLIPENLFQLFAYLKNQENGSTLTRNCEGILLYAKSGPSLDLSFSLEAHAIKVKTINLDQDWLKIEKDLLKVIEI